LLEGTGFEPVWGFPCSAGTQYCRIISPIGVPRPTRHSISLCSCDSMPMFPFYGRRNLPQSRGPANAE
jgi:hypothetical protein